MNVAFDPWIPVMTAGGKRELVSLEQVFSRGSELADLAVRPHERVALMRLFLCVAHAALNGPRDVDDWQTVPECLPEAARSYLETWRDSFELFHPQKPWLQVAELKPLPNDTTLNDHNNWPPLNRICITMASGNNTTLFDHRSNGIEPQELTEAEIAINLLSFQNFFIAGGKTTSMLWGETPMINPPNPKGGPCSGKSILYTSIRGSNLINGIHFNLNTFSDLKFIYGTSTDLGKPIWEQPIKSPQDTPAITNATKTHIGRLVPQTRLLRVSTDRKRVLLGPGLVYPKYQDKNNPFHPDIFSTLILNRDSERQLLSANPHKSIWRELHSLVISNKNDSHSCRGPLCLQNISNDADCDLVVNAVITNPQKAADLVDLVESVFHIPSKLRHLEGNGVYRTEVQSAEATASRLGWAIETYRREIDNGWEGRLKSAGASQTALKAKLHAQATTHYWTTVEGNLDLLFTHVAAFGTAAAAPTLEAWRKQLFRAAIEAYGLVCGQDSPRQLRAFVKGLQKLTTQSAQDEADDTLEKEEEA